MSNTSQATAQSFYYLGVVYETVFIKPTVDAVNKIVLEIWRGL